MLYYQVSVSCELRSNRVKWGVNFNPQIIVKLLTVNIAYSLAKFSSISMVSFQMQNVDYCFKTNSYEKLMKRQIKNQIGEGGC